jgi:hypothetical protein
MAIIITTSPPAIIPIIAPTDIELDDSVLCFIILIFDEFILLAFESSLSD